MKQTNHSAAMRYSQIQLRNSIGTLERCYLAIFVCAFNEPISFEEKAKSTKALCEDAIGSKIKADRLKDREVFVSDFRNYNSKR